MSFWIKKYYRFIAISSGLFFIQYNLPAQSKFSDGSKIEINYHEGIILPENDLLTPIEEEHRKSVELSFLKQTHGKNSWEKLYNYPEYGLSVHYASLGHDSVLGNLVGLDYLFKVRFINNNKFHIYGQSGIGGNYLSKIYDPIKNPLNNAMSSHFNFHFNLRLGFSLILFKKMGFNLGSSFDHISNANLKYPNRGINSISLYSGLTYNIGQSIELNEPNIEIHNRKFYLETILNFGFRHSTFIVDRYYYVPSISIELNNQTFQFLHLGLGSDFFYDQSIEPKFKSENIPYNTHDSYQSGIYFSQAFIYNKFKFMIQEGFYFAISKKIDREKFYNRVVFKYYVNKNLGVHLSLMAHLQDMQYNSVGFDYKF